MKIGFDDSTEIHFMTLPELIDDRLILEGFIDVLASFMRAVSEIDGICDLGLSLSRHPCQKEAGNGHALASLGSKYPVIIPVAPRICLTWRS